MEIWLIQPFNDVQLTFLPVFFIFLPGDNEGLKETIYWCKEKSENDLIYISG